jgi:uncharacterized membrane protein YphA (DoxX/SURF4 family)
LTFANASRLDFSMLMTSLFLLFAGAGPWSIDASVAERRRYGPRR